jgi:hypothetical protein
MGGPHSLSRGAREVVMPSDSSLSIRITQSDLRAATNVF